MSWPSVHDFTSKDSYISAMIRYAAELEAEKERVYNNWLGAEGRCAKCPDKQQAEAELEEETARVATLEAELAKYVWAMNIADGERDELQRKLTAAKAELG